MSEIAYAPLTTTRIPILSRAILQETPIVNFWDLVNVGQQLAKKNDCLIPKNKSPD